MISWRHTYKELLSHKTRILLTVLALAWGTASITCMLAVGEGLRTTFVHATNQLGKETFEIFPGKTTLPYHGINPGAAIELTQKDTQLLQTIPGINKALGIYQITANTSYQGKTKSGLLLAVPPTFNQITSIDLNSGGRFLNPLDETFVHHVIVLGQQYTDALFSNKENPVGKIIQLGNQAFQVIGVIPRKDPFFLQGFPAYYTAYIPIRTYEAVNPSAKYTQITLVVDHEVDHKLLENQIRNVIAVNHRVNPTDLGILTIKDDSATQKAFINFMLGLEIFLGIMGGITLLVAGIGIANVMFTSINQATRSIGIRMAIGAQTMHILLHYLIEAMMVTFAGGFIGIIISIASVGAIKHIPLHSTYFSEFGNPYPILSFNVMITVLFVLSVIGFLAGFFPARHASLIDPVEALNHE